MPDAILFSQHGIAAYAELPASMRVTTAKPATMSDLAVGCPSQATMFERECAADENLPLVQFLARQLHARLPQHVDLEDLVSAGTLGLLDAVARFDGEKKVQFRSYAQFRIRGAMMDSLRAADWSPRTLRRQGRQLEQAKHVLSAQGVEAPNDQQIAEHMGIDLGAFQNLLNHLKRLEVGRFEAECREETGEQVIDSVPAPSSEDPLLRCMQGELRESLMSAIDALPEKERLVLTLYYYEELTMKEVSQVLGVVGSRVSQLHATAILRLKKNFSQRSKCSRPGKAPGHCYHPQLQSKVA